ncbi:hypothetical protein BSL78_26503 [Apostichopus japonicus]|uniref:Uncharacterized protein n=1 Tax=Stichopus japonicus TaxID=307972 RepID=A0A2G8JLR2_STIJA|nr:hypothetical protein BSL78_26503 [Apostichopus japonicus]
MDEKTSEKKKDKVATFVGIPQDVFAWSIGIGFILALLAAMMGFGKLQDWDAKSGWTHNESETSSERFLPEPTVIEVGVPGRCDATASSRWYYWQLPPAKANALSRGIVWFCYASHQLFMWATIYIAQRLRARNPDSGLKYSNTMTKYQWIPLIGNMAFHAVHLAQTHWTYDATAQDVSEASSQSSVIMLLVFVLLLEYRDRGLFFGWPSSQHKSKVSRALRLDLGPINLMRKYHGYAFAWGAIYTFWYHPMENTWGHLFGFIHTWLLMLQGSLMFTKIHLNRYWRLLLESWVTIHATIVAVQTGGPSSDLWAMFFFGFMWLLVMTQLFGLTFWKKLPWWANPLPFLVYIIICIGLYGFYFVDSEGRHWIRLNELVRIPSIEYLAVVWTWFWLWLFLKIEAFIKRRVSNESDRPISAAMEIVCIFLCLIMYTLLVIVSYLVQELDFKVDLIALMVMLTGIFSLLVCITMMLLKQIMRPIRNGKIVPSPEHSSSTKTIEMNGKENGVVDNDGFLAE